MSEDLVDIEVDLPIETIEWLQEKANELNVDLNTYIVSLLKEYLENETIKETKQCGCNTPTKVFTR